VKATNRGIALGLFKNLSEQLLWTVMFVVVFLSLLPYIFKFSRLERTAMGFILGGALGNLLDRIRFGYVLDFLNLTFLPTIFNLADVFIIVGGALMILGVFRGGDNESLESRKKRRGLETGSVFEGEDTVMDLEITDSKSDKRGQSEGQRSD
jgi:signal peptidase II